MHKKILIIIFTVLISINIFSKNILVLHSYNPLYDWTRDVNKGLENILMNSNHNIFIEYLYSRNTFSEEYKKDLIDVLSLRYENYNIDAVVTTDQNAFDLVRDYRKELLPEKPVFFLGAEFIRDSEIRNHDNFFGLFGESNIEKNIKLVDNIYPQEKILITNNMDEFGEEIISKAKELKNSMNLEIININSDNFYNIVEKIKEYPSNTPVLLGNLAMTKEKNIGQLKEISQEFEKALENPLFTLWNNQIGYGAIGGYVTEGVVEGEKLAKKVLEYFENPNIPKYDKEDYIYKFDYQKLQKFNISLEQLPKNSFIINKPKEIINSDLFWIVIVLIHILLLVTLYSFYRMLKMRREKKSIENESFRDTLTNVYNRKKLESIKPTLNDKSVEKVLIAYVVDLDNLKPINDSFGHDVGDKFIIYTAEILKEVFGNNSYIFRMGGDEFYVVSFLELMHLKEEIKELNTNIDKLILKKREELNKPFNLSYGYAVRRSYEDIDQTFKRADESMYNNKRKNKLGK